MGRAEIHGRRFSEASIRAAGDGLKGEPSPFVQAVKAADDDVLGTSLKTEPLRMSSSVENPGSSDQEKADTTRHMLKRDEKILSPRTTKFGNSEKVQTSPTEGESPSSILQPDQEGRHQFLSDSKYVKNLTDENMDHGQPQSSHQNKAKNYVNSLQVQNIQTQYSRRLTSQKTTTPGMKTESFQKKGVTPGIESHPQPEATSQVFQNKPFRNVIEDAQRSISVEFENKEIKKNQNDLHGSNMNLTVHSPRDASPASFVHELDQAQNADEDNTLSKATLSGYSLKTKKPSPQFSEPDMNGGVIVLPAEETRSHTRSREDSLRETSQLSFKNQAHEEPLVHIGLVEVVIQAPPNKTDTSTYKSAGRAEDLSSRFYLRRL